MLEKTQIAFFFWQAKGRMIAQQSSGLVLSLV
jgi:hypothetical protein